MDQPFSFEDLDQGLHLEVAPRWDVRFQRAVVRPLPAVVPRRGELVPDDLLDPGAGLRIAGGVVVAPVALLDVFAERELDPRRRPLELHLLGERAPPELDDLVLAADGVGRSVQDVGRGQPAGEFPVDSDVVGVDDVGDAHLGRDRLARLVHAPRRGGVRVAVDEPGGDVLALPVDDRRAGGNGERFPDLYDFALLHQHVAGLDRARRPGRPDRGALSRRGGRPVPGARPGRIRRGDRAA